MKGRHFDTVQVIVAEPQVVLNNLTENHFQDAFKTGRRAGNHFEDVSGQLTQSGSL
jgi:hypothetical protein